MNDLSRVDLVHIALLTLFFLFLVGSLVAAMFVLAVAAMPS